MGQGNDLPGVMAELQLACEEACTALVSSSPSKRLEHAFGDALQRTLAARIGPESWSEVFREVSLRDPNWPGVGPVDLALDIGEDVPVLIELKWDDLPACAWDMAKLALTCATGQAVCGILVAGAPSEHWQTNPGRELLDPRGWRVDLLLERYAHNFAYWATQVNTRPQRLPRDWVCAEYFQVPFVFHGEQSELRAVMIEYANPDMTDIEYSPVAVVGRAPQVLDPRLAAAEPVEGLSGRADEALAAERGDDGLESRTIALGEGGTLASVDLSGVQADEWDEDEQPITSRRWFRSASERRLYLQQRGLRQPGSQEPDVFDIYTGSGLGPGTSVSWDGRQLLVSRRNWAGDTVEEPVSPDEFRWSRLWRALDRLDVWSWMPNYRPLMAVMDGHGWGLDIAYIGRTCRASGYHAYPDGTDDNSPIWAALELALEELIGGSLYLFGD